MAWVYILHFNRPHHHARHYTGCCTDLYGRMERHAHGQGACLTKALLGLGIGWTLGGLYCVSADTMRKVERRIKNNKNAARFCELCSPEGNARVHGAEAYDIGLIDFSTRYPHLEDLDNGIRVRELPDLPG